MSTISQEESLLLQCLATTSLLGELSNANFLESDYYKQLSFSNKNIKNILTQFGLRNPATMQMMLYALLTVPRETLSRTAYSVLETYVERINPLVSTLIETETMIAAKKLTISAILEMLLLTQNVIILVIVERILLSFLIAITTDPKYAL